MKSRTLARTSIGCAAILVLFTVPVVLGQSSGFTYQGRLTDGGTASNGNYDLQFALWDSASGGTQIGSTQTLNTVLVSNGVFSVSLDFGASSFNGANRFLEISARSSGVGSFTLLTPRQQVTSTPYAVRSSSAAIADTATSATTATNATQLGGIAGSQYVQTTDSRLSDARNPLPGSSNYIQTNPSSAQNANFNISGNGTVAGTLSGGIVNATTQFNIGSNRFLSVGGVGGFANSNTSAGIGAGISITPEIGGNGAENSFFGFNAGKANTTGPNNSFFGYRAGENNMTSESNSFFGQFAGFSSTGALNSFFGSGAGEGNLTGNLNTMLGYLANVGSGDLSNATAIGANARVDQSNSLVLGSISPATSIGIGTRAPVFRLHVIDPGAAGLRVQTNTGGGAVASFGGLGDFQIDSNGVTGGRFIVQQGGNVGIGTNAPDNKLTVNGTADKPGGGSWGTFSDERLKDIKGRFTPGLRAVMQLQPLRYEYKRDNALNLKSEGEHVGFSAQAVQKIIPEAVSKNDKGFLLVNNDPILWTMLNAIKEQQTQIAKLNARLRWVQRALRRRSSGARRR